jgi:hypothetical protein
LLRLVASLGLYNSVTAVVLAGHEGELVAIHACGFYRERDFSRAGLLRRGIFYFEVFRTSKSI